MTPHARAILTLQDFQQPQEDNHEQHLASTTQFPDLEPAGARPPVNRASATFARILESFRRAPLRGDESGRLVGFSRGEE